MTTNNNFHVQEEASAKMFGVGHTEEHYEVTEDGEVKQALCEEPIGHLYEKPSGDLQRQCVLCHQLESKGGECSANLRCYLKLGHDGNEHRGYYDTVYAWSTKPTVNMPAWDGDGMICEEG